ARRPASSPTHHRPLMDPPPSLQLGGKKEWFSTLGSGGGGPREGGWGATLEGSGRARLAASPPTHRPPLRDLPPSLSLRGTKERFCPPRSGGRGPREAG